MWDICSLAPHTRLTCHQRIYGGIRWDQFVRLAISTTVTLTALKTDLIIANNNNNVFFYYICGALQSHFWTLMMPYYFYNVSLFVDISIIFYKFTLHVCYLFNVIWRILLITDGLNAVWSNDCAAPTDTNPKNLELTCFQYTYTGESIVQNTLPLSTWHTDTVTLSNIIMQL